MTVRQQWAFVGIVVLILGGGLLAATRYLGDELFPVTIGSKAPDFHANTIDGAPAAKTLSDYKGEIVLNAGRGFFTFSPTSIFSRSP